MEKTVYILGAGFSMPAGFPSQRELLRSVLDEAGEDILRLPGDILSAPATMSNEIRRDRKTIRKFTDASFPSRERIQLEDVFTLLDETILERAHFAKFPENKLREIRSAWIRAILFTLHQTSEQHLKGSNTGLGMDDPAYDIYVKSQISPFIKEHLDAREQPSPSMLEPFIITPTFTKVFDLPHIQTTWHNAFVELREASKVVFIGYSLPAADYHFRTLLRRAIRSTTPVEVILDKSAEPLDPKVLSQTRVRLRSIRSVNPALTEICERLDEALPKELNFIYPEDRYREIFRKEQLTFDYKGVEGFAEDFAPEKELPAALKRIKEKFAVIKKAASDFSKGRSH